MRKALILMLLMLSISFVAVQATVPVVVTGHVYGADGYTPLSGIPVKVTCNEAVPLTGTTNGGGQYTVEFFNNCGTGDTVTVCIDDTTTCETTTVTEDDFFVVKDIVYVNLQIPEFGVMAAGIALVGATAGFFILRKKK